MSSSWRNARSVNLMCTKGLRTTLLPQSGDGNHLGIFTGGGGDPIQECQRKETEEMISCITGQSYQQGQIKKKRGM